MNNHSKIPVVRSEKTIQNLDFPNDIVLNASGGFDVPKDIDVDDMSSISESSENSDYDSVDKISRGNQLDIDFTDDGDSTSKGEDKSDCAIAGDSEVEEKIISDFVSFDEDDADDIDGSVKKITEVRGRPSACVFVASLSSNLSDDVLCQSVTSHFKQWGEITLVKVLRDPANRPYAFVQYANDKDADKAIAEGQHSILNGRTVRCEKARVNRTLYMQISGTGMTSRNMNKLLSKFGEVERLVAVNDNFNIVDSTKSVHKNWFCKFVYRQDAISAFANLKTKASWNIEWAQNLEDEYSDVPEVTIDRYSIFVGQLDPRISKEELVERFEKHGKIKEAILVNRPLSNFAFIKFKTKDAAASAVERENHSMFKFKTIHVQYREMYNNYKRKYSSENGFRLNLAPPPVNFKRRQSYFGGHSGNNNGGMKSVVFDRGLGFDSNGFNDKTNQNSALFPSMKLKQSFPSSKRFNFNYMNNKSNKSMNSAPSSKRSMFEPNNSSLSHFNPYFGTTDSNKKNLNISFKTLIDKNHQNDKADEFNHASSTPVTSKGDTHEHDTSTMRSNYTYSSGGPKTGYTYSSMDEGEYCENSKLNTYGEMNHMVPPNSAYQYPYYYFVPTKDMPYLGNQMPTMIPDPSTTGNQPPSSAGYYYTYPGYSPSATNVPPPAMYPFYLYYNPTTMADPSIDPTNSPVLENTELKQVSSS